MGLTCGVQTRVLYFSAPTLHHQALKRDRPTHEPTNCWTTLHQFLRQKKGWLILYLNLRCPNGLLYIASNLPYSLTIFLNMSKRVKNMEGSRSYRYVDSRGIFLSAGSVVVQAALNNKPLSLDSLSSQPVPRTNLMQTYVAPLHMNKAALPTMLKQ